MTLSPGAILQQAYDLIKDRFDLALRVFLVFLAVDIVQSLLTGGGSRDVPFAGLLFGLVDAWLTLGLTVIVLNIVRGQPAELNQMFSQDANRVITYLVAGVLYGLIVAVGFVFLIIPGLILLVMFCMFGYIIVDEGAGIVDSLQRSRELTSGHVADLFWAGLVFAGLNALGALFFGIGLAITIPVTMVAGGIVYRNLKQLSYAR